MKHTEIINKLIDRYGYKTYLEIGVQEPNNNFNHISAKGTKIGVDPAYSGRNQNIKPIPSDQFFKHNTDKFDIIFIDGLHEYEQVKRDIENSLTFLNAGGTIVVHDCLPTNENMQRVPRVTSAWTGDVWRAMVDMRTRPDLSIVTIDTDYGVGIIRVGTQTPLDVDSNGMTYKEFDKNRVKLLNVITVDLFLQSIR